jgi:DNA-3-methyladenine glycosylase I
MKIQKRCGWATGELMIKYHDEEWGLPVHNDKKHFEFLVLESAQAGLSWSTILNRRQGYRKAFAGFEPKKVSSFDEKKFTELLSDPEIIRNKLKIRAAINNARRFLEIQKEFGSFDQYIWRFVSGKPIKNSWKKLEQIPAISKESQILSKDLKSRGFSFLGPTTIYAHMQATGLVNDHLVSCFRYNEV